MWHQDNPDATARREALANKGWRIPETLYPPEIYPGVGIWFSDFYELGTDRPTSMGGVGPIPSATLDRYTAAWPQDEADMFRYVIRKLDGAYLRSLQPDGDVPESDNPARDAFRTAMR